MPESPMPMATEASLKTWVSDELMSLMGYSTAVVTKYVINLSKISVSPDDLVNRLVEYGMPSSEDTIAFARKVFDKVPHREPYGGLSSYEEQEREAARLAKKHCKYKLILDDVGDDESDELPMDARKKRSRKAGESHGSKDDEEPTLKRSEALEATDISNLRKASRQAYLKKRRNQKLVELKDEIIDDEYLFGDGKKTEAEERELRYKKKVCALANENLKDIEDVSEYRMPEAYDQDGSINQEKRFGVALKRYRDANDGRRMKPFAEQEEWEEHQIR